MTATKTPVPQAAFDALREPNPNGRNYLENRPRRMVAVTIAISEPASSPEINWPFLLSALVRTHFNSYAIGSLCEGTNCPHGVPCGNPVSPDVLDHDVIRVIDAWRADA